MDRITGVFVDGIGVAAATSGVLTQQQGRIFALLYLQPRPLSLDEVATELQQSKSNVSVNIRGLVGWHLVRPVHVSGSRKDHYEAATDFWRVMQEIMERRFRWNLRQVLGVVAETRRLAAEGTAKTRTADRPPPAFVAGRLETMEVFFTLVDRMLGAFGQGQPVAPEGLRNVVPLAPRTRERG
jgi:DNA-binding transcriptional regulator GbsR (MarR family)